MQEKFLKKKYVLMAFIDLVKAFDHIPCEVVWWALRKRGVDEWLINVTKSMYEGATKAVKFKEGEGVEFEVKVGVHQGCRKNCRKNAGRVCSGRYSMQMI